MRLVGEGCLTCCISVLEASIVCTTVLASIFVRQFAIFSCCLFILAALHNAKRRHERRKEKLAKEAAIERTKRWRSGDGDEQEEAEAGTTTYVEMKDSKEARMKQSDCN